MSQTSTPAEKRVSRSDFPDEVLRIIIEQMVGSIVRQLLGKIGTSLKRVWSKLGNEKFWPVAIVTLLLISEWLKMGVNPLTLWNFPPVRGGSPFPHLSLYAAPLLDNMITSLITGLGISIIYCSRKNLERFWWGELLGGLSRRLMMLSLLFYPSIVVWFSFAAEGSFLLPAWAQTPYWLGASYPLGAIVFRSFETILGKRIFGKQGVLTPLINGFFKAGAVGTQMIGESLIGNYHVVYSRVTSRPVEALVRPNVRPAIVSLLSFLALISMTFAWMLGLTSMTDLFYVFGVAPWGFVVTSVVLGWRKKRRDSEEEKQVTRVPRRLWSKFRFFSVL